MESHLFSSKKFSNCIKQPGEEGRKITIGNLNLPEDFCIIAGPCSVESYEHLKGVAELVCNSGAGMIRGGIYKGRTSPYDFQGLGRDGLDILKQVRKETGVPMVAEVLDTRDVESLAEVVDMIQIGSRNMQNFALLKEVGLSGVPVLLKRGMAATVEEWLSSAEYIFSEGNPNIVLCERGVRTFETSTRNTLDLNSVALLKQMSSLPVIVDPSHGTGRKSLVEPMALAATGVGCDGLMVEVHQEPEKALSDGEQALLPGEFAELVKKAIKLRETLSSL